jgi:hypothetical protein
VTRVDAQPGASDVSTTERAAFYRTALLLGLVRGERVVQWADEEITRSTTPLPLFVELATTAPDDLTTMRQVLFGLSGEHPPVEVIQAVLGLIGQHLASGGRSITDTVTVLGQLRGMVRLPPDLVDDLRRFELESMRTARTGDSATLEAMVSRWTAPFIGRERRFFEGGSGPL